jgi:hypothetical protein
LHLDLERFACVIELSLAAGEGNKKLFCIHGIEPRFMSNFWAKNTGEISSSDWEDEKLSTESDVDIATPMLTSEALDDGDSLDQSTHSKAVLTSHPQPSTKVCSFFEQGSVSTHLDDERTENHKGKIKSWFGPLPPP